MSELGKRLREERERLGVSQTVIGEIGGVKTNAQSLYEKGDRSPDAAYMAAVAAKGVDVLYVITGERKPVAANSLNDCEQALLEQWRKLGPHDQDSVMRLIVGLSLMDDR